MRVYFMLGRSPVDANSVVVTIHIVGVSNVCGQILKIREAV